MRSSLPALVHGCAVEVRLGPVARRQHTQRGCRRGSTGRADRRRRRPSGPLAGHAGAPSKYPPGVFPSSTIRTEDVAFNTLTGRSCRGAGRRPAPGTMPGPMNRRDCHPHGAESYPQRLPLRDPRHSSSGLRTTLSGRGVRTALRTRAGRRGRASHWADPYRQARRRASSVKARPSARRTRARSRKRRPGSTPAGRRRLRKGALRSSARRLKLAGASRSSGATGGGRGVPRSPAHPSRVRPRRTGSAGARHQGAARAWPGSRCPRRSAAPRGVRPWPSAVG
jgi:hypothetical protein